MCNFASENLFDFPAEKVRHIINSPKYQDVISYGYLSESKVQASYIFEQYNPNEYEAYSILCLEIGDYEGFARSLNMAIVLKEKLMQKMRDFQNEVYGEMASGQNFEKFYDLMNISIKNNKANLCKVLKENKVSVFAKALLVETLIGLGFNEIAKNELEKIEDTEKYEKVTTGLITYTKVDKTGGERKNALTGAMITIPNKTVPKAKLNKVVKDLTVVEE